MNRSGKSKFPPQPKRMRDAISFRPLQRADLGLLQRWLGEPHVAQWWRQPLSLAEVHAKYGSRIDGIEPTYDFVIEHRQRPVGWIQWYRWSDYPEHARKLGAEPGSAGIDLAIGEKDMTGKGIGSSAIGKFLDEIVFVDPAITSIVSDPESRNTRSLRAFKKAGFSVLRTVMLDGE